jgi:hypothetical protein
LVPSCTREILNLALYIEAQQGDNSERLHKAGSALPSACLQIPRNTTFNFCSLSSFFFLSRLLVVSLRKMADIANLDPSTQQYLLDLYKILKPGQNPFVVTATILKAELNPELPESFVIQLYILSGVFAFALLCAVITMILRFRRDASMSLFRLIPTSKGNFWCPQTSNSFSLLTGFFLIVAQGNIWVTVRVNRDHASQINFGLLRHILYRYVTDCWMKFFGSP